MTLTLAKLGHSEPVDFALTELLRYLKLIDKDFMAECRSYDKYDTDVKGIIWLGEGLGTELSEDDGIYINISNGSGVISGPNSRSVLIAAYRFLYELGCRFYRYGEEGSDPYENEYIPSFRIGPKKLNISVSEKASYRHRGICIEGSVAYEHVQAIINWLPKVGMNSYYVQFKVPHTFFNDWSEHKGNPLLSGRTLTRNDVSAIYAKLTEDIKKRGLLLHAVGHGWTCEPLGLDGSGWYESEMTLSPDKQELLAQLNGERVFYQNVPLNTNLCYSNPKVRNLITDSIVSYCIDNPSVSYLHFWLADSKNAQCECQECAKLRPSDYYVMMLNELDKKLTLKGVKTKIVFLIYYDLLWKSISEKIENPDRFVLMFAPITRTYSHSFSDADMSAVPQPPAYVRNSFTLPRSIDESLAFLKDWQKDFDGDSFDFDYHLMWDHVRDVGYYECARILHSDMCNLDKIGLNGMISCQVQRAAFPTNLPMYAMAKGLWNKHSDFEQTADEYFTAAFGSMHAKTKSYLSSLSKQICLPYFRRENDCVTETLRSQLKDALQATSDFLASTSESDVSENRSLYYLVHHTHMTEFVIKALLSKASGDFDSANAYYSELEKYAHEHETSLHRVLDVNNYLYVIKASLRPGTVQ